MKEKLVTSQQKHFGSGEFSRLPDPEFDFRCLNLNIVMPMSLFGGPREISWWSVRLVARM